MTVLWDTFHYASVSSHSEYSIYAVVVYYMSPLLAGMPLFLFSSSQLLLTLTSLARILWFDCHWKGCKVYWAILHTTSQLNRLSSNFHDVNYFYTNYKHLNDSSCRIPGETSKPTSVAANRVFSKQGIHSLYVILCNINLRVAQIMPIWNYSFAS
jgi:hypothetical protein